MSERRSVALPCLSPKIVSRQGWRRLPNESDFRIHNGVDFVPSEGTAEGSPLFAVAPYRVFAVHRDGGVPGSGWGGYGNGVCLQHAPGVFSVHAHAATVGVDVGDEGNAGDVVATMGRTSRPGRLIARAHTHFEIVSSWPLQPGDVRSRFDVLGSLAASGILERNGRLYLREEGDPPVVVAENRRSRALPSGYRESEDGGVVLLLGALLLLDASSEGK